MAIGVIHTCPDAVLEHRSNAVDIDECFVDIDECFVDIDECFVDTPKWNFNWRRMYAFDTLGPPGALQQIV